MEERTELLTVKKAGELLEGQTLCKLQFFENVLRELGIAHDPQVSAESFCGWFYIFQDLRKEVELVKDSLIASANGTKGESLAAE